MPSVVRNLVPRKRNQVAESLSWLVPRKRNQAAEFLF